MATTHGHQLTDGSGHPHERPEQWGWHHEFGKARQIMGWFSVIVLVLMITTTHYNLAGYVGIGIVVVALIGGLLFDRHRTRRQWRS